MSSREDILVIRRLNDDLRREGRDGKVMITQGVQALRQELLQQVLDVVKTFDDFTPDNDPHGEHDFGSFKVDGVSVFWKIDYYDQTMEAGSPDPSDPEVTTRVLTIMLAEEY
ncbi:DUF3768 domain-containing protein [Parvibaculum sp.]|uniref:DUF3768 domain-containing protein n=1 Tax=Parvibaculum sp. TaxID=2024848 RepID=UPI00260E1953|nr:DUF3768 domain-containing protein [Parvibaculum sp.]MCW5726238.1 DUF3768 domain-containing protein [Parvibaculum sp.]